MPAQVEQTVESHMVTEYEPDQPEILQTENNMMDQQWNHKQANLSHNISQWESLNFSPLSHASMLDKSLEASVCSHNNNIILIHPAFTPLL